MCGKGVRGNVRRTCVCVCDSTTGPVKIEKELLPQQCGNEVNGPPIVSVLSPARRVPGQSVAIRASKRY